MIADTSYLFSLFNEDDDLNPSALEIFGGLMEETILVPDRVLEELFTITSYKLGVGTASLYLRKITSNAKFAIYCFDKEERDAVLRLAESKKVRMSFVDYLVLYLAQKTGEKLLCFDRQLSKLAKGK